MRYRNTGAVLAAVALFALGLSARAGVPMIPVPDTPKAPAFDLMGADGERHTLSDYRGRLVLVNFWAGWCAPCRREMPALQRLHERLEPQGLTVVAIHVGPTGEQTAQLVRLNQPTFPMLVDKELALGSWKVARLPTSVLVDTSGRIVYRITGTRAWDTPGMIDFLRGQLNDEGSEAL